METLPPEGYTFHGAIPMCWRNIEIEVTTDDENEQVPWTVDQSDAEHVAEEEEGHASNDEGQPCNADESTAVIHEERSE